MRQPILPQLDGPSFLQWEKAQPERYELHHGFVFAFAGGTAAHDQIAFNVRTFLSKSFPPPCRTFGSDMKLRVADDIYYYSDVSVTCTKTSDGATIVTEPQVVVEVLSPSTQGYDLVDKRVGYRTVPSLLAYVIVHSDVRRVEVDRRDARGEWHTETIDSGDLLLGRNALSLDTLYAQTSVS